MLERSKIEFLNTFEEFMEDVSYTKGFPVSWEELHRTAKALAWRLFELPQFVGVIAITRGGMVPAAIVA